MEFLFIDSRDSINWLEVKRFNALDDICICDATLRPLLNLSRITAGLPEDVIHAGLFFYHPRAFDRMLLASLNWFFMRPSEQVKSTSLMASLHLLILKKGVLDRLEINTSYTMKDLIAADISLQVLRNGGLVANDPSVFLKEPELPKSKLRVDKVDQIRFIARFFGKRLSLFAFPLSLGSVLSAGPKIQIQKGRFGLTKGKKLKEVARYSAVIPTINRYAYLKKAIYSLLNNPVPPSEIVVVDQSPENTRPLDYYDEFDPRLVKVHFLKQAGQSTARNYAVRQSNEDWIYFFDDDSEAWEDTIVEHIRLLEYSVADVSTGVSLAPWKDRSYIGDEISFYHVASVLDTGNCMMRRSLVEQVGLFDPAFDKGSGADDNLGKRLFLSGACIVFNPSAIRTHHKAPMGGLRQHGAWWKNKGTYFGPFPLPTDSYDFARFYPRRYYLRLCLFRLISSYRRSGLAMNVVNTLLFPLKVWISYRKSLKLLRIGIR